jgi:DNA-binding XRE family transcriptional regulator
MNAVKLARKMRGMSRQELAAEACCSTWTIKFIENRDHVPMRPLRQRVARALEADVEDLWLAEVAAEHDAWVIQRRGLFGKPVARAQDRRALIF